MEIVKPEVRIITNLSPKRVKEIMMIIERAGRTCYKSESKGEPGKFINGIVKRGHESVIEHSAITVEFDTDRACSMEMIRHRVAAYSQESTRYVNYSKKDIQYVEPIEFTDRVDDTGYNMLYDIWQTECEQNAKAYNQLLNAGAQPQEARAVLNNSLRTTIVATYNLREWRHVFKLRCAKEAHAHIKEIMIPLLLDFQKRFPGMFDDINYDYSFYQLYKDRLDRYVKEDWFTMKGE